MTSGTVRRTHWLFGVTFAVVWVGLLLPPMLATSHGEWPLWMVYLALLYALGDGRFQELLGTPFLAVLLHWVASYAIAWIVSWMWERRLRSRTS